MKRVVTNPLVLSILAIGSAAVVPRSALALHAPDQTQKEPKPPALKVTVNPAPLNREVTLNNSFYPIVQKVAPSVVKISVELATPKRVLSDPEFNFFRRFFGDNGSGDNGFGRMTPGQPGALLDRALGSGVIVSPDGYILTNDHVVKGAEKIQVTLNDGRTFTAKVIGVDPQTDIALLKVSADNLPAVTQANSDNVKVGDVVLAVGNPFGIGQTVTMGIVSAKDRVTSGKMDEDFIQTDAAINPGNSGGALVDTEGRLIGINTEILTRNGGNQGIGFAIPSNVCRWVMESLVNYGHVNRGFIGIEIQDITPALAQAFKLNDVRGALVASVTPRSAGAAAGLKSGDVIVGFNGQAIENASQLKLIVAEAGPGVTIPMEVMRNGDKTTLHVTLTGQPGEKPGNANSQTNQIGTSKGALHGVRVADLDSQARAELNIPDNVHGALVTSVDPSSSAYDAGLRSGDVILEIGHEPVKDAQDAVNDTAKPTNHETLLRIWSQGGIAYTLVPESRVG